MVTITIKEVAALAGVSVATTSRVLSGNPATSAAARARVHAAVAELDYHPNAQARALRRDRRQAIGLLVPDVRNPFFADLAHTVEQAALAHGYATLLGNANERTEQQDRYLDNLISRRVDGIIVAPLGDGSGSIRSVIAREIPAVFVDRTIAGLELPSVTTDSGPGIREAVAHLVDGGHTRIGFIAGPQAASTGRERHAAFVAALAVRGLALDPALVCVGDFQAASGAAAVRTLLAQPEPPTALLVADSLMAAGAITALQELGRPLGTGTGTDIGTGIALVAFDDIDWFALLNPAVSVIAHSVEDMGRIAVELLRQVIDGGTPDSVRLPSRLVVRASSTPSLADTD
jgi:LacI family transcriptional regulator